MNSAEKRDIESQILDLIEDGPSSDCISRLGQLLNDRPDLQRHYARYMSLNTLLRYELDSSIHDLRWLHDTERTPPAMLLTTNNLQEPTRRTQSNSRLSDKRIFYVLACSLLVALIGYRLSATWRSTMPPQIAASSPAKSEPQISGSLVDNNRGLSIANKHNLLFISKSTRTPQLASLLLPVGDSTNFPAITFCSGTAWMEQESGLRDRGHLVAVPPGFTFDLQVDADSALQNSVFVFEIDDRGLVNGNVVNFGNVGNRSGVVGNFVDVGHWSQRNSEASAKYYLVTGSHKLSMRRSSPSEEEPWQISDYKVWLDLPYLIYIGWDDSNYSPNKKPNVDHADHDFDDICAVVQVIPPPGSVETQGKVKYFPTPKMGNLITKCSESDFEFAVPPSTATMIRIVTRAGYRNAVEIVAQDSNEVIWRLENSPGAKNSDSQAATVYCIENRSDKVQRYKFHATHQAKGANSKPDDPWLSTAYKVLIEEEDRTMVGYEDRLHKEPYDWDDLKIQLHRIQQLP